MKKGWILSGFLVLLLAIVIVPLTACGGTSDLVGNWQNVERVQVYIKFFSDGTAVMGDETGQFTCTYEETGDKEITLTLTSIHGETAGGGQQVVFKYSISGDELTLITGNVPVTFTRVK